MSARKTSAIKPRWKRGSMNIAGKRTASGIAQRRAEDYAMRESGLTFQSDAPGNPRITFIKDAQGQVNELIPRIREREMRGKKSPQ